MLDRHSTCTKYSKNKHTKRIPLFILLINNNLMIKSTLAEIRLGQIKFHWQLKMPIISE